MPKEDGKRAKDPNDHEIESPYKELGDYREMYLQELAKAEHLHVAAMKIREGLLELGIIGSEEGED